MSVSSQNFLVVGDAGEDEMRRIAARLEQLRAALPRLAFTNSLEARKRTTVLVFRSKGDYEPFIPPVAGQTKEKVIGHFRAGTETDYVALSTEVAGEQSAQSVALHEYVHALLKNSYPGVPLWLDEGLAEYYSTFELSGDSRRATVGRRIGARAQCLREGAALPLKTLFAVDHYSPYYNSADTCNLFYAESWALAHYLMGASRANRGSSLANFLELQAAGTPVEESLRLAFNLDFAGLEKELARYARADTYAEEAETFAQPLEVKLSLRASPLSGAEAQAFMGTLLLKEDRLEEAEAHLQLALEENPTLTPALVALGALRLEQNRYEEAKEELARAVLSDPRSYLAHYYYAEALARAGHEMDKSVPGYLLKTAAVRAELKKAIELEPQFPEAYLALAETDLKRSPSLDETVAMLKRAAGYWPRRDEFPLLLSQAYLRAGQTARAREVLDRLGLKSSNPRTIAEVQNLLKSVAAQEEALAEERPGPADVELARAWSNAEPCDMPEPGPQIKRLRFRGRQVCGQLTRIECADTGSTLFVEARGQTLKLHSDGIEHITFVTYMENMKGRVECGARSPATPVLVTYRAAKAGAGTDGEAVAVEFVPPDWGH
ncbi:MAG TPA: tetratricopeptide repeat protein [Pyrinomonadaceae bacterium]